LIVNTSTAREGNMAGENEIQVPRADTAYDFLYGQIHAPVFFTKLAQDYGIVPADDAEATRLLEMGADLFAVEQQAQEKQAQSQGSFIGEAHNGLQVLLGKQASARDVNAPANDRLVKAAAAELTRNPYVRAAALAYQLHLAQQQG
jgi:hypothetical protein